MKIFLENYQVLQVSGKDSLDFLQGQVTNDINKLDKKTAQLNAVCQHQGRVIAITTIIKNDDGFYLILPIDMVDIVFKRLSMFIVISDVSIKKNNLSVIGVLGGDGRYKLDDTFSFELVEKHNFKTNTMWETTCIENKIAEISSLTSEKFTPQMLNLDIEEIGVNFSKGCYTGQEIVARLHYLGKSKRRLFKFSSDFKVSIGDEIKSTNPDIQKTLGTVIRVIKLSTYYHFLATFEVDKIDKEITINNKQIQINEQTNNK